MKYASLLSLSLERRIKTKKFINLSIIFLGVFLALIFFARGASAETYYVNGSAAQYIGTQGTYEIGNDLAPGDGTLAHPWATITKAQTAADAGSTIYVAASVAYDFSSSLWAPPAKALSYIGDNITPGGKTIIKATGGTAVLYFSAKTDIQSFSNFTFDCQGTSTYAIKIDGVSAHKSFTNVDVIGLKATSGRFFYSTGNSYDINFYSSDLADNGVTIAQFFYGNNLSGLSLNTVTLTMTAGNTPFFVDGTGNGTISLDHFVVNAAVAPSAVNAFVNISGTSKTVRITNSAFNATWTGNNVRNLVYICDQYAPLVTHSSFSSLGTGVSSLWITASQAVSCGAAEISYCDFLSHSTGGLVLAVGGTSGSDVTGVGNNMLDGALIHNNIIKGNFYFDRTSVSGSLHGLYYGFNKNGNIYSNYINGCYWGMVIKGAADTWTSGNISTNIVVDNGGTTNSGGTNILVKGQINVPIYNNTSILNPGIKSTNGILYIREGDTSDLDSSGTKIKNNIFWADDGINLIKLGDDGSSIAPSDVDYNLSWNSTGSGMDYLKGATTYSNFASWQAAGYDTHGKSVNPLFISPTDFNSQPTSPAIDAGANVSLTTDFAGSPIYGTPDIGAYEYQPPHTDGIDKIDKGAGARIYGDGKFRDVGTTNSTLADLKIKPSGGSFAVYGATDARPAWLDVSVATWDTTGAHHKNWTESNAVSGLNNTEHIIGDLDANKNYNITVSGTTPGQHIFSLNDTVCTYLGSDTTACKSDNDGKLSFRYDGGYSDHTFDLTEGDNTQPTLAFTDNIESGPVQSDTITPNWGDAAVKKWDYRSSSTCSTTSTDYTKTDSDSMDQSTETNNGKYICLYGEDTIGNNSTLASANPINIYTTPETSQNNNTSDPDTTSAPEYTPTLAFGNHKTYTLDPETTLSVKNASLVFRGQLNSLPNGRVELYQDGRLTKHDKIRKSKRWRIRTKERSRNATHTYQFKYYDQNNNLVETSQIFTIIIDREKPRFTYLPKRMTKNPGDTISWQVSDNDQIKYYEYTFRGRKVTANDNFFMLSSSLSKGQSNLAVRAYDRAGNKAVRRVKVRVR